MFIMQIPLRKLATASQAISFVRNPWWYFPLVSLLVLFPGSCFVYVMDSVNFWFWPLRKSERNLHVTFNHRVGPDGMDRVQLPSFELFSLSYFHLVPVLSLPLFHTCTHTNTHMCCCIHFSALSQIFCYGEIYITIFILLTICNCTVQWHTHKVEVIITTIYIRSFCSSLTKTVPI